MGGRTSVRAAAAAVAIGAVAAVLCRAALEVAPAQSASAAASATAAATEASKEGTVSGIDEMIAHLHESFHITPAQEPSWDRVAGVMRANAAELTRLAKARVENAATMTAVDDLKSYAHISEVHAQGTQRLIPAFQALYDSMSPEQKQEADREFREHYRHPASTRGAH